ncbi:hypothetical protein ATK36_4058 [Amycolatopsis sulphurea]|uniref:Uncharacterized protein n=1 Tax=Amycolatopsis sulphurea TaxID=76022 RepID=A0A2A9FEL1_9PSEU|nr:hypothetical protein [Amycolatopsis sulphurea]PFG48940.1 hypothetical protein ATK36_4058 [Amycolatopsis sulphurea]
MGEEQKTAPEQAEKKGLRPASVAAAALAAVTAALLGSKLGVAGTVLGAGLASVITSVGGELYLRSLHRTRDAAMKARDKLATAGRSRDGLDAVGNPAEAPTMVLSTDPSELPTVRISQLRPNDLAEPDDGGGFVDRLRKLRWPLVIGTSAAAFVGALVVLFTVDWGTGGAANTGLYPRQNTSQQETTHENKPTQSQNAPATNTPSNTPTTKPATPTTSSSTSTSQTEQQGAPSTTDSSPPPTTQKQQQTQTQTQTQQPKQPQQSNPGN